MILGSLSFGRRVDSRGTCISVLLQCVLLASESPWWVEVANCDCDLSQHLQQRAHFAVTFRGNLFELVYLLNLSHGCEA